MLRTNLLGRRRFLSGAAIAPPGSPRTTNRQHIDNSQAKPATDSLGERWRWMSDIADNYPDRRSGAIEVYN
jgi:hypothetical protein